MTDPREIALRNGLRQLENDQLDLLIKWIDLDLPVLLDRDWRGAANYSAAEGGTFCPLAIALGLPGLFAAAGRMATDYAVTTYLRSLGLELYNTRGIEGEFYTTNRREDLREAAEFVRREFRELGERRGL